MVVAAALALRRQSRVGGPLVKGILSKTAGRSLKVLARVGTHDANSFKAYSTEFIREVGSTGRSGFEIGLELTAKARRLRVPSPRSDDLAGPDEAASRRPRQLDPALPAVVPVRVQAAAPPSRWSAPRDAPDSTTTSPIRKSPSRE